MNKRKSVEEWRQIIETARNSGLSDKDWCLENDVSINTDDSCQSGTTFL